MLVVANVLLKSVPREKKGRVDGLKSDVGDSIVKVLHPSGIFHGEMTGLLYITSYFPFQIVFYAQREQLHISCFSD